MSAINASASYLRTAILSAGNPDDLNGKTDEWLNDHIANEVVSMQLAAAGSEFGDTLFLLIVYRDERRVRRA